MIMINKKRLSNVPQKNRKVYLRKNEQTYVLCMTVWKSYQDQFSGFVIYLLTAATHINCQMTEIWGSDMGKYLSGKVCVNDENWSHIAVQPQTLPQWTSLPRRSCTGQRESYSFRWRKICNSCKSTDSYTTSFPVRRKGVLRSER